MISAIICLSLCGVSHLCNLPCVYALFWLVPTASYVFKCSSICFQGTKYEINREHAVYLHSTLRRRALYGSLRLPCGEDNLSPVELPTLAVMKSTNKSQTILIYGSPEVERFQLNWWILSLIYWLKRGRKISVLRRAEDRMEEDFFHRISGALELADELWWARAANWENSNLNGIRTHDLCDIGAVHYQLHLYRIGNGFESRSGLNFFFRL